MTAASNAPRTSVIVPAFNEGPTMAPLIVELRAAAPWREILADDDGSTDLRFASLRFEGPRR